MKFEPQTIGYSHGLSLAQLPRMSIYMACSTLKVIMLIILLQGRVGRWCRAYHLKVPPPPMPPQPSRGGPRQRIPPTPRGVNMIIWSLDNRFVLAAIMGNPLIFSSSKFWNIFKGNRTHVCTCFLLEF